MGSLCGLGDLVLTCTGSLSRNWTVGNRLAKGEVQYSSTVRTKQCTIKFPFVVHASAVDMLSPVEWAC